MVVSTKDLRERPGNIIRLAQSGKEIVVTYRGVESARIVPMTTGDERVSGSREAIGMWANRDEMKDPTAYVRKLREKRRYEI